MTVRRSSKEPGRRPGERVDGTGQLCATLPLEILLYGTRGPAVLWVVPKDGTTGAITEARGRLVMAPPEET